MIERFHSGRNASEYPGNGLGLAIVKAIVNAHGAPWACNPHPPRGAPSLCPSRLYKRNVYHLGGVSTLEFCTA